MKSAPASILASVFRRNGGSGSHTKLFDEHSSLHQDAMLQRFPMRAAEEPVVAHWANKREWCLLTSQRLLYWHDDQGQQIEHDEILEATMDMKAAIAHNAQDASDLEQLKVVARGNRVHVLRVERGPPFSGCLNVLKFLARRNHTSHDAH